eukprot:SAG11_NODE_9559_length_900_cov_2.454432_1_plen_58_part_01
MAYLRDVLVDEMFVCILRMYFGTSILVPSNLIHLHCLSWLSEPRFATLHFGQEQLAQV